MVYWFIFIIVLFGLALKSDFSALLTATVILASPLRFYLTFKWVQKERK